MRGTSQTVLASWGLGAPVPGPPCVLGPAERKACGAATWPHRSRGPGLGRRVPRGHMELCTCSAGRAAVWILGSIRRYGVRLDS